MSGNNTLERREQEDKKLAKGGFFWSELQPFFGQGISYKQKKIAEEEGFCLQPYDN